MKKPSYSNILYLILEKKLELLKSVKSRVVNTEQKSLVSCSYKQISKFEFKRELKNVIKM